MTLLHDALLGVVEPQILHTPPHVHSLAAAEEAGCTTVDGIGMLIWQAVPGFERWFGQRPEGFLCRFKDGAGVV